VLLIVAMLTCAAPAVQAQTPIGTKVVVSWTPSASAYDFTDLYVAAVQCPATGLPAGATLKTSLAAPIASYDHTDGVVGTKYCYYTKARNVTGSVQSVASNTAGATFPSGTIDPHTNTKATIP
jgi:hypothetical protein